MGEGSPWAHAASVDDVPPGSAQSLLRPVIDQVVDHERECSIGYRLRQAPCIAPGSDGTGRRLRHQVDRSPAPRPCGQYPRDLATGGKSPSDRQGDRPGTPVGLIDDPPSFRSGEPRRAGKEALYRLRLGPDRRVKCR